MINKSKFGKFSILTTTFAFLFTIQFFQATEVFAQYENCEQTEKVDTEALDRENENKIIEFSNKLNADEPLKRFEQIANELAHVNSETPSDNYKRIISLNEVSQLLNSSPELTEDIRNMAQSELMKNPLGKEGEETKALEREPCESVSSDAEDGFEATVLAYDLFLRTRPESKLVSSATMNAIKFHQHPYIQNEISRKLTGSYPDLNKQLFPR